MTQPLNYCTHAAENMMILKSETYDHDETMAKAMVASVKEAITLMHLAEKFILPEWGKIFEDDEMELCGDIQIPTRLPYPITALEYHCPYDDPRCLPMMHNETASSKRIAMCVETEALHENTAMLSHLHEKHFTGSLGFYVFPICYFDEAQFWSPPASGMFFPRGGNEAMRSMKDRGLIEILPIGQIVYSNYPKNERSTRIARDIADEVFAMIHLLTALAIDKGKHTILPAPAKLNKKRAKKNRVPMYEYKVLDIVADILHTPTPAARPSQGGTHASPRMHKRRGHVRRLRSGKTTWVRNMIIGKPGIGVVEKEYSVHE